jgi:hypothetical protein
MRKVTVAMILLLLGGFAVLQGLNQENQSGTRFLTLERGKRLADLVRDTDRELVIEDHLTIADKAPPNEGYSLAHWKTVFSDVVLVVRVSQVQSALTPEQDWITTTVRATAQEVLKNSTAAELRQGTQLKFKLDGGEILLGRTRVHAHSKLAKHRSDRMTSSGLMWTSHMSLPMASYCASWCENRQMKLPSRT